MLKKSSFALARVVAVLSIGAASIALPMSTPAQAQSPDPCSAVICLSGMLQGQEGGAGCIPSITAFFAIQIWSPLFNPPATAAARAAWLAACPAPADADNMAAIIAAYGSIPAP